MFSPLAFWSVLAVGVLCLSLLTWLAVRALLVLRVAMRLLSCFVNASNEQPGVFLSFDAIVAYRPELSSLDGRRALALLFYLGYVTCHDGNITSGFMGYHVTDFGREAAAEDEGAWWRFLQTI